KAAPGRSSPAETDVQGRLKGAVAVAQLDGGLGERAARRQDVELAVLVEVRHGHGKGCGADGPGGPEGAVAVAEQDVRLPGYLNADIVSSRHHVKLAVAVDV